MINSLYVDNFRCFSDFEYHPSALELLLGDNGSGKSSVFDVLACLRDVVSRGIPSEEAFPARSRSAWADEPIQQFRLGMKSDEGQYQYTLVVEHDEKRTRNRITSEKLTFEDKELFEFDGSEVHLFRDDGSAGPAFPFDWTRSAIATIPERPENQRLTWFRGRLRSIYVFSPDPRAMRSVSQQELDCPDRELTDLASWLRHVLQDSFELAGEIRDALREVIDGFASFQLEKVSDTSRELRVSFEFRDADSGHLQRTLKLPFDALSDGQRSLFALYTILHAGLRGGATICVDEPDNFVALREIQPWLIELRDKTADTKCQCLLISHHPEMVDYLAADHGTQFFRDATGASRTQRFAPSSTEPLKPSELLSRGWE